MSRGCVSVYGTLRMVRARWKSMKRRVSFKGLGCCGSNSPARTTLPSIIHQQQQEQVVRYFRTPNIDQDNVGNGPTSTSLATALAAERTHGNAQAEGIMARPTMRVKNLVTLIEETDGVDLVRDIKKSSSYTNASSTTRREVNGPSQTSTNVEDGGQWVCCVCMERDKGAAFIPCGHSFCRVCSSQVWINRGSCPVCNISILDVLHIF